MQIPAGSPIPINLQLWDGNNGAYVKAFLTSENGEPYSPSSVELESVGNGLYLNTALNMPVSGVIFASLFVYADSGYSIVDNNYTADSDVFTVQPGGGSSTGGTSGCPVVGFIIDPAPLVGIVENEQTVGTIENTPLTGQIDNPQTVGEVENTPVTGKIEC